MPRRLPTIRVPRGLKSLRVDPATAWARAPALGPALVVVLLLACVLVPLPQLLVDLLLTLSLAGAVLLVVGALRVDRPSAFVSFPNLLILVTLFRIALNVSTTRLILSEADAGRVIDAFAGAVVRDDLIVGAVMFAIVTTVQYLVIARGTERVAEVGARFALDGMPGRQAAIDAELRAGVITAREASRRRAELDARSSFFGAMDGASRYVRGDAIAGLVIIAINLVGGIAVGTARAGLSVQESLEVYGRLAIGDGLMAQLPAVLVSLAAGVLVSRVEVDDRVRARWFEPAMLGVPAALLIAVAFVPGMPTAAFGATGIALVTVAIVLGRARSDEPASPRRQREIEIEVPPVMESDERRLRGATAGLRGELEARLGTPCPPILWSFTGREGRLVLRTPDEARADLALAEPTVDAAIVTTFRGARRHADRLVDATTVDAWIETARATHPALVDDALRCVDRVALIGLVRALLRDGVRLPTPRVLLAALAEHEVFGHPEERPRWLARLREVLAPTWLPDLLDAATGRRWIRPTPDLELALADRTHGTAFEAQPRAVSGPGGRAAIAAAFVEGAPCVVLTSATHRLQVAAWLRETGVPVVSIPELEAAGIPLPARVDWRDESILDPPPSAP